jgi:hypothetical protein
VVFVEEGEKRKKVKNSAKKVAEMFGGLRNF